MVRLSKLPLVALVTMALAGPLEAQAPAPQPAPQAPRKKAPAGRAAPVTPPSAPAAEAKIPEPTPPPPPPTDVKAVTAYTQGAQVSQNTTYIRGPRQRVEFPGLVSIDQCDLQRTVMVNPESKRYRVQAYAPATTATPAAEAAPPAGFGGMQIPPGAMGTPPQPRGGVITVTTTLTDTLERQQMFGLEARRIKTVVTRQPSADACDKTPARTEIDAWYVDLPRPAEACARVAAPASTPPPDPAADSCQDRIETRVAGDVTLGFPVKTATTIVTGEGEKQDASTTKAEITTLEITRLDGALFDVPADYTEAKSLAELAPATNGTSTLAEAIFGSTATGSSQAAPKQAGVLRIGVLDPVNKSTRTTLAMPAVRQDLVTRLTKGRYEALPLRGSSVADVTADMTRLECDYVLATEVLEVKTSKPSKVGGMFKAATGGGPNKDRHEVKMAYRLYPATSAAAAAAQGDVKADNGGGFGLGSALRMAAFAGQMYMGFAGAGMMRGFNGSLGGLGMGMGMMNPMYGLATSGGMGAMGGGFFDPRSMAMSSMAMSLAGGLGGGMGSNFGGMGGDGSDQEVFAVASEAAGDVARATTDALTKRAGR